MNWVIGILAFFLTVFSVNGFLAYSALSSSSVLVEDSPYEKGLQYQSVISKKESAVVSGMLPTISVTSTLDADLRLIHVSFDKVAERQLDGAEVLMRGKYVLSEENDFAVSLAKDDSGAYQALVPMPGKGLWQVELEVTLPEASAEKLLWQKRLVLR